MAQPTEYRKLIARIDAVAGKHGATHAVKLTKKIPGAIPAYIVVLLALLTASIIAILPLGLPRWLEIALVSALGLLAVYIVMHVFFPGRVIARSGDELIVTKTAMFSGLPKAISERWTPPVEVERGRTRNHTTTMKIDGTKYSVQTRDVPLLELMLRKDRSSVSQSKSSHTPPKTPSMPIPDRSELPDKFVDYIIKQNKDLEEYEPRGPVLPAASTPPELIEAARVLDDAITRHSADGSSAAPLIDKQMRQLINDVLDKKITKPINENQLEARGQSSYVWEDRTDRYEKERRDLNSATVTFQYLLIGHDNSTPAAIARTRKMALSIRKELARRWGVDLDLTDEQWWQL